MLLDGELKKLSATLSLKRVLRRCDDPNHAGYHSIGHCSLLTPDTAGPRPGPAPLRRGPSHVPMPERPYPIGSRR